MTVDELLEQALNGLGYPVFRLNYTGEAETYFVFQNVTRVPEGYADDDNCLEWHIFRINLYTKTNYMELLKAAKMALKQAGFTITSVDGEIYEKDTEYYHVPITVGILEDLEG